MSPDQAAELIHVARSIDADLTLLFMLGLLFLAFKKMGCRK